jgi:tetratricopeptide (TPR) repeat protein
MFKLISKLLGQAPQQEIATNTPNTVQTENTLDQLKEQINAAIEQAQFELAITKLQEAIRIEKENAGLYVNIAFCLLQQGKIAEAECFLHQALQQDEKHIDAHFMLASVLANQGKHDTAIKEYETVLALNPSFAFAYKELAILYLQQQQIEQASAVIDKGLTAAPTFTDLHFLR